MGEERSYKRQPRYMRYMYRHFYVVLCYWY